MDEIFVDNFAGGGGASTGIEIAIGHSVDIAINHDPDAIAMHRVNHPASKHYCEDVWQVDPVEACAGRPVALAWFSPDCTHFSRAKGGKPVDKNIRGLAWVVIKWALAVRPRAVMLENVPEIQTWCPLGADSKPIKARSGETFKAFISVLSNGIDPKDPGFSECLSALEIDPESEQAEKLSNGLGFDVEYRELLSCDYGAPTKRKRFYLIARSDGKQIVWPEREYGDRHSEEVKKGELKPWHSAAECIDWSIPMKSIFERKKPLADATCKRIARGIEKYVVNNADPFIVNYKFDNAPEDVGSPLSTVTAVNSHYVVAPSIVPVGYGERKGQAPRVNDINDPLSTVVSSAVKQNVVAPVLIQYHSEQKESETRAQEMREPIMTVDTSNRYGLVSAFIQKYYSASSGSPVSSLDEPLHTVTAKPRHYMTAANIMVMRHNMDGQAVDEPLGTVAASTTHHALVESFLVKYYKSGENVADIKNPAPTITAKDRLGVVTIHGVDYEIVDIRMRMLQPHELFKCMGFPDDYIIDHDADGKPYPKSKQVARCGNAVTPPVATALVRANLPEYCGAENAA